MVSAIQAAIALLLILSQKPVTPTPPVEDVIAAVSRNAQQFRDQLPDLVCSEKVVSTTFVSGKVDKMKIVESLFSVQQWHEHREIVSIDSKPVKKNAKMPDLPLNVSGTFTFHVLLTFQPKYSGDYDFAFADNPQDSGRWVVQFATKAGSKLTWDIAGERSAKDKGRAWIDPSSMQVARIERSVLNLPRNLSSWTVTVEQQPVVIGDRQYWLPKTFTTEVTERDPSRTATFVAEYSNCKKFTADVSISPVRP